MDHQALVTPRVSEGSCETFRFGVNGVENILTFRTKQGKSWTAASDGEKVGGFL